MIMRPPSTLLPSHTMLWLISTTMLMFINIAADAQQSPRGWGLAGIIPNENGIVELPEDSWLITKKEQLDVYITYNHTDKTFQPCNVDISDDGM